MPPPNAAAAASSVTLANGVRMPRLGLGVWQAPGHVATRALRYAIEIGYRHVDTAAIYGNEKDVGKALRECGVPREQLFVATKLWTADHDEAAVQPAFDASLARLGLDYVDLYLSHFPVAGKRLGAWRALAKIQQSGKAKAIGVSNYTVAHLTELIEKTGVVPAVNQVELHPYLYQKDLLAFCQAKKIQVEAYSPLTHGKKLGDPKLALVAERYERTPAQVLIRWGLQHDLVVIPKSSRPERIEENADVFDFELSVSDMRVLDSLNENLRTCWDPTDEP
jgi:diketogulonate reductase-like aldo/keto reductase